jgi:hypothetical protein
MWNFLLHLVFHYHIKNLVKYLELDEGEERNLPSLGLTVFVGYYIYHIQRNNGVGSQ